MISPWKNPLPQEAHLDHSVVICAYQDGWVPITFSCLKNAIRLYHKGLLYGEEIFVFPRDLAPWSSKAVNCHS